MFDPTAAHGEVISRVEIPLIQRDYAQGRRGEKVDAIRTNFLTVLHDAIAGEIPPLGLDFVYGELKPDGTLQPLDGQQRLTTLFLLHWYIAARTGNLKSATGWTAFSYETRPSARRFCQRLVDAEPPADATSISDWIQEQPWYLYVWRYDPTINSMLVMIDAIAEQFAEIDVDLAWERLTHAANPAISFHLLPLPDMGSAEDLYVKMNSRGKPLTDFESFKARFEKAISWSRDRAKVFAHRTDTVWSDVLWQFRGNNDLVDDEYLRYFEFVTEICEWDDENLGSRAGDSIIRRATRVFGVDSARRDEHLEFLFTAFDVWVGRDIKAEFDKLCHSAQPLVPPDSGTLPLFFRDPNPNLFESACRSYGDMTGATRTFTFGQTLMLLAVVLHLAPGYPASEDEFASRLRVLRNLIEGSQFEMRAERMPRLVADTRALILNGDLPQPGNTFAVAQISDENEKRAFLAEQTEATDDLKAVEDNYILKGSTAVFDLDVEKLPARGAAFNSLMAEPGLWWDLTAALLTFGEYQWPRARNGTLDNSDAFQFGTWDSKYSDAWREVLVGRTRADSANTAAVLSEFLDAIAASPLPLEETLARMKDEWLQDQEAEGRFDWRYYLVKYRTMREGASGLYFAHGRRMGFSLTNLPGGKKYRNANFRDPYLLTIYDALGRPADLRDPKFSGYEWEPRWMRLTRSDVGVRAVPEGFEVQAPQDDAFLPVYHLTASQLGAVPAGGENPRLIIKVAKATADPLGPDSEDRIQTGSRVVRRLIDAGL